MGGLVNAARRALTGPWLDWLWTPLTRGSVPIFMLHRFAGNPRTHRGFSTETLERQLALLRRRGFMALRLDEAVDRIGRGRPLVRSFVITVDDGYHDFFRDALPVFSHANCPVTVFLTTGFIDGTDWMWWDQVRWMLENTSSGTLDLVIAGRRWSERWTGPAERARFERTMVEWLKTVTDDERRAGIAALASTLAVPIPGAAPPPYRPMSWSEVRQAATQGVTFGPHTVTHPVLARCDDARCRFEIETSWRRLRDEVPDGAIPVFCYPNGTPADQGPREFALLDELGLSAAVTTTPGRAGRTVASAQRFEMPRFAHPASDAELLQLVLGLDRDRG